ncbi:MAG: YHS domain-containing protein, partial [Micromonosporaceae bacterium]|nr:YHS domain-containing protein [Micromonosporaceae bacterium]
IIASRPPARPAGGGGPAAARAGAVDPVCGMSVAVTPDALSLEHAGRTWYFCGTGCREAAAADPQRYLAPSG